MLIQYIPLIRQEVKDLLNFYGIDMPALQEIMASDPFKDEVPTKRYMDGNKEVFVWS